MSVHDAPHIMFGAAQGVSPVGTSVGVASDESAVPSTGEPMSGAASLS
jgi:hypothetical protein